MKNPDVSSPNRASGKNSANRRALRRKHPHIRVFQRYAVLASPEKSSRTTPTPRISTAEGRADSNSPQQSRITIRVG